MEAPQTEPVKALLQSSITISEHEIGCYILDTPDKDRVLSRQGVLKAIGRNAKPTDVKDKVEEIPNFLRAANLKPFITSDLLESSKPIEFVTQSGKKAIGYRADILKDICYVFIDANKAGALKPQQSHIAERCEQLVRGFASVGLRALVDEATGFQEIRPRDDLQRYLDAFLLNEYAKWVKRFPDEFFENIFKMKGWTWKEASTQKPGVVGKYINDIVYDRLAPYILEELRVRNPPNEKGNRKVKHHQFLTPDIGHGKLQEHLYGVLGLQRIAGSNWTRFQDMLNRAYPRYGHTLPILFSDLDDKDPRKPGLKSNDFNKMLKGALSVPPPKPEPKKPTKKKSGEGTEPKPEE